VRYRRSIAIVALPVALLAGALVSERVVDHPVWASYLPFVLLFGFGAAIGRWWAVPIPASLVLSSIPLIGIGEAFSAATSFAATTALGVAVRAAAIQTRRDFHAVRTRTVLVVLAYLAAMGGFMAYAATLDAGDDAGTATVAFLGVQVLVGLVIGRWRALFLVAFLPILAIPVPTPEDAYEPLPLWFGMLIFSPLMAVLISLGVAARQLWERLSPVVFVSNVFH